MIIRTVGDLKKAIEKLDDNLPVHIWNNATVYDAEFMFVRNLHCIEHNGKRHEKTCLIIDFTEDLYTGDNADYIDHLDGEIEGGE